MVVFLSATLISCSQAMDIIHRLKNVVELTEHQKMEIIQEVHKTIPLCPINVVKDE
jgi:hypothetical protein